MHHHFHPHSHTLTHHHFHPHSHTDTSPFPSTFSHADASPFPSTNWWQQNMHTEQITLCRKSFISTGGITTSTWLGLSTSMILMRGGGWTRSLHLQQFHVVEEHSHGLRPVKRQVTWHCQSCMLPGLDLEASHSSPHETEANSACKVHCTMVRAVWIQPWCHCLLLQDQVWAWTNFCCSYTLITSSSDD